MEKILIIRLSAMGDAAIAAPVLQSLTKTYPDKKIYLLTRKAFFPIFEYTSPTIELFAVDAFLDNGIFGIYQLFVTLRGLKIDKIADFHNVLRTNMLGLFFYFTKTKWVSLNKIGL